MKLSRAVDLSADQLNNIIEQMSNLIITLSRKLDDLGQIPKESHFLDVVRKQDNYTNLIEIARHENGKMNTVGFLVNSLYDLPEGFHLIENSIDLLELKIK